jgi:TatD DNase family protein
VFVDSHCHLNYLDDPQAALERARARGVAECLCIGVEQSAISAVLAFANEHAGVWASVGEHPGSCSGDANWIRDYLDHQDVVACGEMGLDYHAVDDVEVHAQQRHTFDQQLDIAAEFDLPVIIHTRAAEQDTLAAMRLYPQVRGVLHCFTESWAMAQAALEMGYFVSISGIVTFKNAANVREVAVQVPLQRLLIETDSPWLAPVPHRGAKNEPSFVVDTAEFLADLRGISVPQLAEATRANFFELFSRASSDHRRKGFLV